MRKMKKNDDKSTSRRDKGEKKNPEIHQTTRIYELPLLPIYSCYKKKASSK